MLFVVEVVPLGRVSLVQLADGTLGLVLVLVVIDQALGLRLEDAQRTAAATCQLGELLGPEEQHDDQQDQHDLPRTGSGDERLDHRSEEHTSELQSLMRISYAVFCLKKKNK